MPLWAGKEKSSKAVLKKKMRKCKNTIRYPRLLILWHLYVLKQSIRETALQCNVSPTTVQKWKRWYPESWYDGLFDPPRSGRPTLISGCHLQDKKTVSFEAVIIT